MSFNFSQALKWSTLNNVIKFIYSLVVPILLARILGPEPFGILAMAFVVVGLSQIFIEFGIGDAVVRSSKINEEFLSSLFWFNFLIGSCIYVFILIFTPIVSDYFQKDVLNQVIPILSTIIFFQLITIITSALMRRRGDFLSIAKASFISKLISSIGAIYLALYGYGLVSLIFLSLSQAIIYSIILTLKERWIPKLIFSLGVIKSVFKFTISIFYIRLLNHFGRESDRIFIGPAYGEVILGIYTRTGAIRRSLERFISGSLGPVLFSATAKDKDFFIINNRILDSYVGLLLIFFPLFCFFYFLSTPITLFLFGDEWKLMIDLLKPISFLFLLRPFFKVNVEIIKAHLDMNFLNIILSFYLICLILLFIFFAPHFGIEGYIYAIIISNLLLFVSSTIYLFVALRIKFHFFIKLIKDTFLRNLFILIFSLLYRDILNIVGLENFYLLEILFFPFIIILILYICQKVQPIDMHQEMESFILDFIKK